MKFGRGGIIHWAGRFLKYQLSFIYFYLFGVLRRFQHCTGHITMGSWKGRGNRYIQFIRVVYCKLPTNGKQLPAFPLEAVSGNEPRPQRWEARSTIKIQGLWQSCKDKVVMENSKTSLYNYMKQCEWVIRVNRCYHNVVFYIHLRSLIYLSQVPEAQRSKLQPNHHQR